MNNAEIKIVGAVTDESALEEIENIARVFAYEQRMKDYTRPFITQRHQAKKVKIIHEKKMGEHNHYLECIHSHTLVKGLC